MLLNHSCSIKRYCHWKAISLSNKSDSCETSYNWNNFIKSACDQIIELSMMSTRLAYIIVTDKKANGPGDKSKSRGDGRSFPAGHSCYDTLLNSAAIFWSSAHSFAAFIKLMLHVFIMFQLSWLWASQNNLMTSQA